MMSLHLLSLLGLRHRTSVRARSRLVLTIGERKRRQSHGKSDARDAREHERSEMQAAAAHG